MVTNDGRAKADSFLCQRMDFHSLLTFRNVALSLVTMDGFTRMLSCMMDVKL